MNAKRYEQSRRAADCLGWVFAGGPRLRRYLAKQPKKVVKDCEQIQSWWSPNIAGFGFGPKNSESGATKRPRLSVRFYVYRKLHESRIDAAYLIPRRIAMEHLEVELPTDVVELEGDPVLHALPPGRDVAHFTGTAGTIGCYVRKRGTTAPLLLSCAHVLAPPGALHNAPIESPVDNNSQMANNRVGSLAEDVGLQPGGTFVTDAAIATLVAGVTPSNVVMGGLGQLNAMPLAPVSLAGKSVSCFGAVTKRRVEGVVSSDLLVTMNFTHEGRTQQIQNLLRYEILAAAGDSGMPVMETATRRLLGIHVGAEDGTTHCFFAPSWVIATKFNVEFWPG